MKKNTPIVRINNDIIVGLFNEFFLHFPNETGGIIMGFEGNNDYWITHIIGPGPNAIHEKRFFKPDNDYHEREIASLYNQSKGKITYLGDWHTHPSESAYLSELDKSTLKKIANYKLARLPNPLMVILGSHPLELKCWKFKGSLAYSQFHKLEIALFNAQQKSY